MHLTYNARRSLTRAQHGTTIHQYCGRTAARSHSRRLTTVLYEYLTDLAVIPESQNDTHRNIICTHLGGVRRHDHGSFNKKLKNVSCEYDRLNSRNSTLQAAWYIRHVLLNDTVRA